MTRPARKITRESPNEESVGADPVLTRDQTDELLMKLRLEHPETDPSRQPTAEQDDLGIIKGSAQFGEDGLGSTLSS
ncbi:MAG: hypothetical protein AABZ01_01850 [Gemmatimonadota bacterium]